MSERTVTLKSNESPRFENGVLKWYEKNTFGITFYVNIKSWGDLDDADESLDDFNISIEVFNDKGFLVFSHTEEAQQELEPQTGYAARTSVTLTIDSDATKKFPWGSYSYRIKLTDKTHTSADFDDIRTVYGQGRIEVELCH